MYLAIVSPQVKALNDSLVSPPELAMIILETEMLEDYGPDWVGGQDVVLAKLTVCHRPTRPCTIHVTLICDLLWQNFTFLRGSPGKGTLIIIYLEICHI